MPSEIASEIASRRVACDDRSRRAHPQVVSGGAAALDGRLRLGDKILSINEISLRSRKLAEAMGSLGAGVEELRFRVLPRLPAGLGMRTSSAWPSSPLWYATLSVCDRLLDSVSYTHLTLPTILLV